MSTRPTDLTATLLPPSATAFERDLEQVSARMADVATPMATLYNANTCPAHLLGWLAWALSVDEWDPAWPEDVKRDAIRTAPLLHQRKGTVWALQNALKPLGMSTRVEEWFSMRPVGEPGTFRVTTLLTRDDISGPGPLLTPHMTTKIDEIIECTKPVARHYSLRIGVGMTAGERETTALRPAQPVRADLCHITHHVAIKTHATETILRPALAMKIAVQPGTHHLMASKNAIALALRPARRLNIFMVTTQ